MYSTIWMFPRELPFRLREANLNAKPSKCSIAYTSDGYL